jgi:hypothetical protein
MQSRKNTQIALDHAHWYSGLEGTINAADVGHPAVHEAV